MSISVCTFFGHRQCPQSVREQLREVIIDCIEHHGVDVFYVGNQGDFDAMVQSILREVSKEYPHITYTVVLAYLPTKQKDDLMEEPDYSDTIYPEGIEAVPKRFAIDWRNRWMLHQADYVISHITHSWGGAAKFASKARRAGKVVINIELESN